MQKDKALLPFGGYPTLMEYQYRRLLPHFKKIFISTKKPQQIDFGASTIEDNRIDLSTPLVGFVSIFDALSDELVFVLGVDMPYVGKYEAAKLLDVCGDGVDAAVATTCRGTHPLCAIYSRNTYGVFQKQIDRGEFRLRETLKMLNSRYVDFKDEDKFANLNYQDEYNSHNQSFRDIDSIACSNTTETLS